MSSLQAIRSTTQSTKWRLAALAMIGLGVAMAACAEGEESESSYSEISEQDYGADLALTSRAWVK